MSAGLLGLIARNDSGFVELIICQNAERKMECSVTHFRACVTGYVSLVCNYLYIRADLSRYPTTDYNAAS